jgi:hypothetical protein
MPRIPVLRCLGQGATMGIEDTGVISRAFGAADSIGENFRPGKQVSSESLGLMSYNPAALPV